MLVNNPARVDAYAGGNRHYWHRVRMDQIKSVIFIDAPRAVTSDCDQTTSHDYVFQVVSRSYTSGQRVVFLVRS
jgi:hypothetical protein